MNQFETVENVDAYHELANAIVVLDCDDYRDYKKHFRKNEDVLAYINQRLGEVWRYTEEHYNALRAVPVIKGFSSPVYISFLAAKPVPASVHLPFS